MKQTLTTEQIDSFKKDYSPACGAELDALLVGTESVDSYLYHRLYCKCSKAVAQLQSDTTFLGLLSNFAEAITSWAQAGFPVVSESTFKERAYTCLQCPFWDNTVRVRLGKCNHPKCGCTILKAWLATEACPDNRWKVIS